MDVEEKYIKGYGDRTSSPGTPPPLPWSVATQINEREMRMRCLELGDSILRERNEWRRRDAADDNHWALRIDPTHQELADDLMAYVLTGEHREFFRERGAPPLAPHDGVR